MKTSLKPVFLLLSVTLISAAAQAAPPAQAAKQDGASYQEIAALLAQDSQDRNQIDNAAAPIRSSADLNAYLQTTPVARTPLGPLSPDARRRFIRSLTFNDNGLTGFDYRPLSRELSASEIYRVLSLFGMQHDTALIPNVQVLTPLDSAIMGHVSPQFCPPVEPDASGSAPAAPQSFCPPSDHMGYECLKPGDCWTKSGHICTSNC